VPQLDTIELHNDEIDRTSGSTGAVSTDTSSKERDSPRCVEDVPDGEGEEALQQVQKPSSEVSSEDVKEHVQSEVRERQVQTILLGMALRCQDANCTRVKTSSVCRTL
jgi:hypothetical protein